MIALMVGPIHLLFSLCLLALAGMPAVAADLLAGKSWTLVRPAAEDMILVTVPVSGTPGGSKEALRLTVVKPADPYWRIEISQTLAPAFSEGTRLRLHFWGRSPTHNPIRAVIEQAAAPYNSVMQVSPTLTDDWKEYTLIGSPPNYGPNGLGVRFQVGQQAGVVDLAGITLEDFGPDPAYAAAQAALAPAAVQARIRRYRMTDLTVLVHDAHGRAVPDALVKIAQTRHAFLFGCNFFGLNPDDDSPGQVAYRSQFAALFNYATLPFYWGAFEPLPGKPHYTQLDAMAQWCVAHGITPKGHPLIWHEVYPSWTPNDPDAAIPFLHQRVTDIVSHYKQTIHYFDVVNEANSPDVKTGEGAWIRRDGAAKVVETALDWARAADLQHQDTFLYNDYNTGADNVALLTQLKKDGKLPDAVGIQSHMHSGPWPLTKVWQTCEAFAQFGKPIHFTETTVLSGPMRPIDYNGPYPTDWLTTPEDEAKQADYVVQFYTLLFSHPSVRAITWWDFSDAGAWLGAPAGMLRRDMTPKPVYTRLLDLIHKAWWTDAQGGTDKGGRYQTRAFYGDYRITAADAHGHTVTQAISLPESSGPHMVTLTLP